jgi:hypothetical protein
VPSVRPNENSRLGIRTWLAASVRTASHFWKQQRSGWWLQNSVTLPTRSFFSIPSGAHEFLLRARLNLQPIRRSLSRSVSAGLLTQFQFIDRVPCRFLSLVSGVTFVNSAFSNAFRAPRALPRRQMTRIFQVTSASARGRMTTPGGGLWLARGSNIRTAFSLAVNSKACATIQIERSES